MLALARCFEELLSGVVDGNAWHSGGEGSGLHAVIKITACML
jgi:hypothetical protein